ncbi:MAG TPA: PaaI family thioesterase [Candidatus Dormibacteraeota bacterium]
MPFADLMGVEVVEAAADKVRGRMAWRADLCTAAGILHGGALMAFADSVGALCAVMNLPEGHQTSTIESKTNFFRAVRDGHVEAVATPLHVGRSTIVVQTEVRDAEGKRVTLTIQTQAVLAPRP